MKCPYCLSTDTKVTDKRDSEEGVSTRRRRECLKCEKRFTTYERVETLDITVIKKDGRKEPFDRDKVRSGLKRACEKRPIGPEKIDAAVDQIEASILKRSSKEVPSKLIGDLVLRKLKSIDKVAYVRFASVYKEFNDLQSFEEELEMLINKNERGA